MPYDWRLNPYVCIKCETRQQACRCCDNGKDSIPFVVVIDGCGTFAGRYEFDAVRYKSPTALPTGMSYPASNPCGVFIGTISAGEGCTAGGVAWTGELKLVSWCDGTDAEIPWHVEIYCYNDDANQWESQGEATVTSYECLCSGPRFAFTLPTLDCCCDGGGELIPTDCCPDGIPSTLTASVTNSSGCGCVAPSTYSMTYDGVVGGSHQWSSTDAGSATDLCGNLIGGTAGTLTLRCESGFWSLQVECAALSNNPTSQSCDPFQLVFNGFSVGGCCSGAGSPVVDIVITA